jgi:peroxiredoxin
MAIEMTIPDVTWNKRHRPDGAAEFSWQEESSEEIFKGKRVVLFALPGAYTPTCSTTHLPVYEANYQKILDQDIDEVYCLSVNDSFVMNSWFNSMGIVDVKPIADGNGDFTRHMGMLVKKEAVCFGSRSQRYSMVVDNGRVEMIFCEEGKEDNFPGDPFQVSDAESMLEYLTNVKDLRRAELGIADEETADTVSE